MLIINRHYPFVMIDWGDFEKILKALTRTQLLKLYINDYGKEALHSKTKRQIIDYVFTENEGDIV